MAAPITQDLQQNIMVTLYLLFSHNDIAIAYFTGLLFGIGLSIYRPSRFATLVLVSFAILLFQFEYDKHIIDGLREQTMNSLITEQPHMRFQRLINITISELIPVALFVMGWGTLFIALFSAARRMEKHKHLD